MVDKNQQTEESYLNNIFPIGFTECITLWANKAYGSIVDILKDCVLRFVEYYRKQDPGVDDFEVLNVHNTTEDRLTCPIVAEGIVVYWLCRKRVEGIKAIFEGYYDFCLEKYEKAHEGDEDAWKRNLKKEFVCHHHILNEKKCIKSSEALFAYVTESDQKKIKSITDNYLKFARAKRKELYPPNHPANRMIEDTFLDAYRVGGPAYECMSWMRTEYNLPNTDSIWFKLNNKTTKEKLSGIWKERHEKGIPEYVTEGYEDFDDHVLKYSNGGLMDEINENIKKCQTQEDRIRYIISLLQPFKDFAEAFYSKAKIDARKRAITEHEKWISDWETMPDDAVDERTGNPISPKDQISACKESIEEYKQDIEYWKRVQQDFYWFAQHGLGAGHYREYPQVVNDKMCEYLGGWWGCMITFARRLAALALTYGIKLMDVQERCEVYLMWRFIITDYVDYKYITSTEHARRLLDEIEAKKPKKEISSNTAKEFTWEEEKQCFKSAVLNVMEEKRKTGDYFFEKPTHWIAVYRVAVDCGVMYDMEDPNEPQDKSKPQYDRFKKLAHELKLDVNPPTRIPFTKKSIDSIKKPNYVRYNAPYPWSKDELTLTKSINLYSELENIYKLLKVKYHQFVRQAEDTYD